MKTSCAYDGTMNTFKDGRCVVCGRKRREAIKDARAWDIKHRQYLMESEYKTLSTAVRT